MPLLDSATKPSRVVPAVQQWLRDAELGLQNLMVHGLRSLLTMLGMIFGVAAVVAMLSIGAGARQKVMAFIEQMGVHNLIVEAKETTEWQAHAKIRRDSAQAFDALAHYSSLAAGNPRGLRSGHCLSANRGAARPAGQIFQR
jgi:hypothetical protein